MGVKFKFAVSLKREKRVWKTLFGQMIQNEKDVDEIGMWKVCR